MDRPFPAYQGDEPYIFVSYLHKDASAVFPELTWLKDLGLNIWFDEGIEAGAEWREEIGRAIKHASLFLYFVSPESVQSDNCRKEVSLADKEHISIVAIHLKNTDLPDGLDLTLSDRQAILKYEISKQEYQEKLQARISSYLDQPIIQSGVVERKKTVPIIASVIGIVVLVIGLFAYNQQDVQQVIDAQPTDVATPDQTAKTNTNNKVDLTALRSIAVLPFVNMSTNEEIGFVADGLSEDILDNLAQIERLSVASRSASFQFTGRGEDPLLVGEKLKVAYLLEGSVRQQGENLRITAQLVRANDGFQVWSKTYERVVADDFETQTAVAMNIAFITRSELSHDVERNNWVQLGYYEGIDPLAVRHYFNARNEVRKLLLGEGGNADTYLLLLKQAVRVDPNFTRVHDAIMLAAFGAHRDGRLPLQEAMSLAYTAMERIMALDPDNNFLKLRVAHMNLQFDLDYERSKAGFDQFSKFRPEFGWLHYHHAQIALREGRTSEAIRHLAVSVDLDSHSGNEQAEFLAAFSELRCMANDCERALDGSREAMRLVEGGQQRAPILVVHAQNLIMLDRIEEARPLVEEAWRLGGTNNPARFVGLFVQLGETRKARDILSDPRYELAEGFFLASGHLALGDIDSTFKSIRAGIENRDPFLLETLVEAKMWDPIRDDPRFGEMLDLLDSKVTHTKQYLRDHQIELQSQ